MFSFQKKKKFSESWNFNIKRAPTTTSGTFALNLTHKHTQSYIPRAPLYASTKVHLRPSDHQQVFHFHVLHPLSKECENHQKKQQQQNKKISFVIKEN